MFTVTKASPEEFPIFLENLTDAVEKLYRKGCPMWSRKELSMDYLRANFDPALLWLARMDGKVCGSMFLEPMLVLPDGEQAPDSPWKGGPAGKALLVRKLIARSEFTGRGVASGLLSFAAEEAARQGCVSLRLDCYADRPALTGLYERNGFILTGFCDWGGGKQGAYYYKPVAT